MKFHFPEVCPTITDSKRSETCDRGRQWHFRHGQVMHLDRNGTVTVTADTGEEGNKSGSGSCAALAQPMGLCTEGDNNFMTDTQIGLSW